ncbi:MAG: N-acetylmuramoyl-L-alanine amidase-like domain-containing protein [Bdellovibrionia bacterium]
MAKLGVKRQKPKRSEGLRRKKTQSKKKADLSSKKSIQSMMDEKRKRSHALRPRALRKWVHRVQFDTLKWSLFSIGTVGLVLGAVFLSQPPRGKDSPDALPSPEAQQAQLMLPSQPQTQAPQGVEPITPPPASAGPKGPQAGSDSVAQPAPEIQKQNLGPLGKEFQLAQKLPFAERVKFWSSFIEGNSENQKKIADLAEGYSIEDVAPLVPSSLDCTTYVETVAALSRSERERDFVGNLLSLRYKDGKSNYASRNHFPEADWIPNNQRSGLLTDITQLIAKEGGLKIQVASKKVDRAQWLVQNAKKLGHTRALASVETPSDESSPQISSVPYIDLKSLKKVASRIPDGTIINLVRRSHPKHPVLITHQGFLVKEKNQLFFRHASSGGRIRTNEFFSYLKRRSQSSWPVLGVNLNQLKDSSSEINRLSDAM